jgi:putative transcriptional regulator
VRSAELLNHNGIKASLIRLQQGAAIPQHGHRGTEYTVVLDGSFSDEDGIYHQGDFLMRKAGDKHSPTATTDKDCWCLTALEAPLKFSNPLYELFNRVAPL